MLGRNRETSRTRGSIPNRKWTFENAKHMYVLLNPLKYQKMSIEDSIPFLALPFSNSCSLKSYFFRWFLGAIIFGKIWVKMTKNREFLAIFWRIPSKICIFTSFFLNLLIFASFHPGERISGRGGRAGMVESGDPSKHHPRHVSTANEYLCKKFGIRMNWREACLAYES